MGGSRYADSSFPFNLLIDPGLDGGDKGGRAVQGYRRIKFVACRYYGLGERNGSGLFRFWWRPDHRADPGVPVQPTRSHRDDGDRRIGGKHFPLAQRRKERQLARGCAPVYRDRRFDTSWTLVFGIR